MLIEATDSQPRCYVIADDAPHIHVYSVEGERATLVWEITDLGSPVSALFVRDLNKDGEQEILIATQAGRIMAYDADGYHALFENFQETFTRIPCLITANIDQDKQEEVIFIGQPEGEDRPFLFAYDSHTQLFEWKSSRSFDATEMLIANVDDDEQLEIILNTGYIIDSQFYTQEPGKVGTAGFGRNIYLLDINGDGFPEVIGEIGGYSLKVYDLYSQRELW